MTVTTKPPELFVLLQTYQICNWKILVGSSACLQANGLSLQEQRLLWFWLSVVLDLKTPIVFC